jgi:hypothetical protein
MTRGAAVCLNAGGYAKHCKTIDKKGVSESRGSLDAGAMLVTGSVCSRLQLERFSKEGVRWVAQLNPLGPSSTARRKSKGSFPGGITHNQHEDQG